MEANTSLGVGDLFLASCRRENAVSSEDPGTFTISGAFSWAACTIAIRPSPGLPLEITGFEDPDDFGTIGLELIQAVHIDGFEDADEFGTIQLNSVPLRWSFEHLEADEDYDFAAVYVEIGSDQPVGSFPEGLPFEKRLAGLPVIQEAELDSRYGFSGFQKVTLIVDNTDGALNGLDLQGMYVRMFFTFPSKGVYREFNGRVADWILSHACVLNVEDIDAIAISGDLPKRSLNQLVETEKLADAGFEDVVVADDLGSQVPVVFGRAVKVPLLYVKADETAREYDYIIAEGKGYGGGYFQGVFMVYREDMALDEINGTVAAATGTTLTLEAADRRPDGWYRYWWAEIVSGLGAGQIRDVTAYDSTNNRLTVSAWTTTPNAASVYRLREWRFFDGSQASPYAGFAFVRFKKRLGVKGRTDQLYADVNGFSAETNIVRAIQSVLSNQDWGLGLVVDADSFDDAAALPEITAMLCEGALLNTLSAVDYLDKLLSFRDMVLTKHGAITISVDRAKTPSIFLGLGDDAGNNNIANKSPEIQYVHPSERTRKLRVRYRKNHKETGVYIHEIERQSLPDGVDKVIEQPFIYAHVTGDIYTDYKRKRLSTDIKKLEVQAGDDAREATRGMLALVNVPSLGLVDDGWEVVGAAVPPAGAISLTLKPYSELPYTYVPITDEGGTLSVDESFDIPPDYTSTAPDPIDESNIAISMQKEIVGFTLFSYMTFTVVPPEDNYGGIRVRVKHLGEPDSLFKTVATYVGGDITSGRTEGLVPGRLYVFSFHALNVTGEHESIGTLKDNSGAGFLGGGDPTAPVVPTGLVVTRQLGKLIATWNKNAEADVSHYVIEWYSLVSGGALLRKQVIPHLNQANYTPRDEFERNTGNLQSLLSGFAQVSAVDHSGNASAFSSPRQGASTKEVLQGDVKEDEIDLLGQFYAPGSTTSSPTHTVTVTTRGKPVDIEVSWVISQPAALILTLKRDGATIWFFAYNAPNLCQPSPQAITIRDLEASAGSHTYTLTVGNNPGMSNRSMKIKEARNAS